MRTVSKYFIVLHIGSSDTCVAFLSPFFCSVYLCNWLWASLFTCLLCRPLAVLLHIIFFRPFVPSPLRPFVPSSLRPFVPSSLRPFVPSSLRPFVPSPLRPFTPSHKNASLLSTYFKERYALSDQSEEKKKFPPNTKRTMTTMKIGGWAL